MRQAAVSPSTGLADALRPLPPGWRWVRLGDVCEFKYGSALSAVQRRPGPVPVYGSNGVVGAHDEALTSGPAIIVGRKGSIGEVHLSRSPCWPIDTTYFIERPKIDVDLTWLASALKTLDLSSLNKAAAVPGLNREDAYSLELLVPPLSQQEQIVRKLGEQMAAVERARAAAEAQLEAAKALPAAGLRSVFDCDAAQKWPRRHVSALCKSIDYGYTASADHGALGPRYLRITDIQDGKIEWPSVPGCRISAEDEKSKALADGDIVFARTGATTGKSILIKRPPQAVFASYLIRLRPTDDVNPEYLYAFFQSDGYWRQVRALARGGAQPNVNATLLGSIEVPVCPPSEQERLCTELASNERIGDAVRRASERQLVAVGALPAALLRRAFSGEL